MIESFGIKDILDIVIVALMLYYLYKIMKESGTINIFYGVLAFVLVWVVAAEILEMKLIGTILDKVMSIGLLILVIIFQDQIKRFLVELGSKKRWKFLTSLFHHRTKENTEDIHARVMPIVYACMNMSKSKTGALIVIQQDVPLENYEKSGDMINAEINSRLIENIFFKNSPLHDGAMVISRKRIRAAGCILPVSHSIDIPKELGLRHRAAMGMSQHSDAITVVVSEETGRIAVAINGKFRLRLSAEELESILTKELGA